MKGIFETICSDKNLEEAYLAVAARFDEVAKSHKYKSLDGQTLNDFNASVHELLTQIKEELQAKAEPDPTPMNLIEKKNGGHRTVYVVPTKERIKAQAISQVLFPYFESTFGPFLYSYRSNFPCHLAARAVIRRYTRHFGADFVFRGDVSAYFEEIDLKILEKKLQAFGFEPDLMQLLRVYVYPRVLLDGKIIRREKGIVHGHPLAILFANYYLADLDNKVGKMVSLYRRVGDDVIICDKDEKKVEAGKKVILDEVKNLNLRMQETKTSLGRNTTPFNFLGYDFADGIVSINPKSVQKMLNRWKYKLRFYPISIEKKQKRLEKVLFTDSDSVHADAISILSAYRYANDKTQAQKITDSFFRILTRYFFGRYSPKNHRKMMEKMKNLPIPNYFMYFISLHNGKTTLRRLTRQKKKHRAAAASPTTA